MPSELRLVGGRDLEEGGVSAPGPRSIKRVKPNPTSGGRFQAYAPDAKACALKPSAARFLESGARRMIYRHKLSDGITVRDSLYWLSSGRFGGGNVDLERVTRYFKELRDIGILPFSYEASSYGVYGSIQAPSRLLAAVAGLEPYHSVINQDLGLLMD